MKLLALERERPGVKAEDFQPYMHSEASHAWDLYRSNIIREAYFDQNHHTAVFILECNSEEEASRALGNLPLVQAGLIEFDIIPLAPYDGYQRLFQPA